MSRSAARRDGPESVAAQISAGERFGFGANWARFLRHLDDRRVVAAEVALCQMLERKDLRGLRFLDAGSGSGLSSLAASRLGAVVRAFDYDPQSVACTRWLAERHAPALSAQGSEGWWTVEQGSVLDRSYLQRLGEFDIVYSWGVVHHTGHQWAAIDNLAGCVRPGGRLFIAVYNDQGVLSRYWLAVKKLYNRHPSWRWLLVAVYTPYFVWMRWLYARIVRRGEVGRGMTLWHDMIDWLGGFPFEVATPEAMLRFLRARGFELKKSALVGRSAGCNEYVFERKSSADWRESGAGSVG